VRTPLRLRLAKGAFIFPVGAAAPTGRCADDHREARAPRFD